MIKTDNGSEFIGKVIDKWAYERGIEIDFSQPGKPTDTAWSRALRKVCLSFSGHLLLKPGSLIRQLCRACG